MIIHFHFQNYVHEYLLPSVNDRRVKLNLSEELKGDFGSFIFEVWDNIWHILPGEDTTLKIDGKLIRDHIIQSGDVINGTVTVSNGITPSLIAFAIRISTMDDSYTNYEKFAISNTVKIGGDQSCDIVITDEYVSRHHAVLQREGDTMTLRDSSTNGTYVLGRRVDGITAVDMMDDIYIAGVKLVYMGDFIAINRIEKRKVNLPVYSPPVENPIAEASGMLIRSPRIVEPIDTDAVELESPPEPQRNRRRPIIFTIGPAITMPLPIMASMAFNLAQGTNRAFGMVIAVIMSAFLATCWAVANLRYDRKQSKEQEEHRQDSYLKYISENEALLKEKQSHNTAVLSGQFLSLTEFLSVLPHNEALLWNRNPNQSDFLTIRLGTGYVKSQFPISVPKRRFSLVADDLQAQPHKLSEKYELIP